ncbi:aldo/keto reductase [Pelagicoccus mobilis]|uniref:Aldo/keto reductase n=1 Tax=Pelagicoccus mobilis TaxID=415221 RepID=A0A934VNT3_9BACT|nr:aldo/keto reductase [Pelagicoccus mobilis]MBK1876562.1 aldo/keto reductase [Pelagicoccus mobilis]
MEKVTIGKSSLESTRLVYGCMRIAGDNSPEARKRGREALKAAYDAGYNHFDHADIYGAGACEEVFAEAVEEFGFEREKLIVTSKCGIHFEDSPNAGDPKRYDFSRDHILRSVEGSLKRLKLDSLDLFLLHRPDYLMDAAATAATLQELVDSGMVRNCGVSNFSPSQFRMLQSFYGQPLVANQVEINIHNVDTLKDGTLDQCQELGVAPMAWCPIGGVAYPAWGNTFSPEDEARIKKEVDRQAAKYGVEDWVLILAWILKLPARVLPIIGSTTPERIRAALQSLDLEYSREDWYLMLEARDGNAVP